MTNSNIPNPQKEYWNIIATSVSDEVAVTLWVDENNQPVNPGMFAEIAGYLRDEFLPSRDAGQVLEIGCGNSLVLTHLRSALPSGWQLHGLDISEEMLRRARSPGLILTCGEANRLPYAAGSFDLIFLHSVTQYFGTEAYLRQVIAETIVALRPGGSICLLDVPALWYRDLMGNRTLHVMVRRKLATWSAHARAGLRNLLGGSEGSSDRQREVINGVAMEVPKFTGYYADTRLSSYE